MDSIKIYFFPGDFLTLLEEVDFFIFAFDSLSPLPLPLEDIWSCSFCTIILYFRSSADSAVAFLAAPNSVLRHRPANL